MPKETLRVFGLLCGHVTPSKAILVSLACYKHRHDLLTAIPSNSFRAVACLVRGGEFHTTLGFDPGIWDQNIVANDDCILYELSSILL